MKNGGKRRGWGVKMWMRSREEDRGQSEGRGAEGRLGNRGEDGEKEEGYFRARNSRERQLVVSRKVINVNRKDKGVLGKCSAQGKKRKT